MIYFLRKLDGSAIKIGTTIRLSARLQELAAEHGELEVLAVTDGSYPEENALHKRFANLRTVGEWFEPGDDLIGFIVAEGKPWDQAEDSSRVSVIHLQGPAEERDWLTLANKRTHLPKTTIVRLALQAWGVTQKLPPYPFSGETE